MTGQRTSIEVVLDCLRILEILDEGNAALFVHQDKAIRKMVQENLDELLRPMYARQQDASTESSSESGGASVQQS